MEYLNNDFLLPIILGDGKEASRAARFVYENTKIRPYIFSTRFTISQRLMFKCRKLQSLSDLAVVGDICKFACDNECQSSLLLIYSPNYRNLIQNYSFEIESRYIAIPTDELINLHKENN